MHVLYLTPIRFYINIATVPIRSQMVIQNTLLSTTGEIIRHKMCNNLRSCLDRVVQEIKLHACVKGAILRFSTFKQSFLLPKPLWHPSLI